MKRASRAAPSREPCEPSPASVETLARQPAGVVRGFSFAHAPSSSARQHATSARRNVCGFGRAASRGGRTLTVDEMMCLRLRSRVRECFGCVSFQTRAASVNRR
ncbi:MAG TPA: hypothetical protein VLJ61_10075 [Pyrinomonadaceae bacterium]|nr:hypothetical protein [Pyrinomonadaceae bacterium]